MVRILSLILAILALTSCNISKQKSFESLESLQKDSSLEVATFAGGCFWCIESAFESYDGVEGAVSGYSGGDEENPTYEQVSSGLTGHRESVQVYYDPNIVSYKDLLEIFWHQIDPTDDEGSFVDKGFQYTSAIYYHNGNQKKLAEESKKEQEESGRYPKPIVTVIEKFKSFYKAEDYHQDYYKKKFFKI